jgi:4-amino-4-deoxy-L-arabinose transferase-like glycosyltransferase
MEAGSIEQPELTPDKAENPPPGSYVHLSFELEAGTRVRVTVEALPAAGNGDQPPVNVTVFESQPGQLESGPVSVALPVMLPGLAGAGASAVPVVGGLEQPAGPLLARLRAAWKAWPYSLAVTLFGLGLVVYLATRLIGLVHFPIYFFTDEAVQTVLASDLVHNHFKNYAGDLFPTFFENGGVYRLGVTVYLQILPYLLLGKSLWVTRAVSVLVSLGAAVSVGLMLRRHFKISYWWSGVLFLSITPAWFLHSRTAFEYPTAVAFYSLFLFFYLEYRYKNPRFLYLSLAAGALAFYSYSPFQVIMVVSGVLLALSDARYHWQQRAVGLRGLGLLVLLALPYVRFWLAHGNGNYESLLALGSYWTQPASLADKVRQYFTEYLNGLNPAYWFDPNSNELARHLMKGYGHLLPVTLPFFVFGLFLTIKGFRSSANRAVLIALVAAPTGAALVELGVTRALVMVIPAALLTTLGVDKVLTWLETRRIRRTTLSLALFAVLCIANLAMLRDALVNGPTWYTNYGMDGMQYGAAQVFGAVKETLQEQPGIKIIFSPDWANGTDVVARFFLPDPLPIQIASIEGYLIEHLPLDTSNLFIMTPDEYQTTITSGKFTDIQVERILPYPDDQPGFYFVRMRYTDRIDQILAAEQEARKQLQEAEIMIDGQTVKMRYSLLDMGEIQSVFDGNLETVARTFEANPFVMELTFPEPRSLSGLSIKIGATEDQLTARLYAGPGAQPAEYSANLTGTVEQPTATIDFGTTTPAQVLYLEIKDLHQSEPGHVHVWEITLR